MKEENNNYSVYEHITPDGMYYFGVTTDIKKRWKSNGVLYKTTSLQPYIDKYGWDNIQHQVLFTNQTKENALWIEDFLIRTAKEDGVCINRQRSGLITKEENYYRNKSSKYREEHREEWNKCQRKYREEHREELNKYHQQYIKEHREKRNKYQRKYYQQYREEHREELRTYMRNYMRKYSQKKKDLKTLNELGYIPLF